jgi:CBS domain-containing protein
VETDTGRGGHSWPKASAEHRIPTKAEVEEMSEQTSATDPVTAADIMRPPLTTVEQADHVAAAAYLMKRAGTTALMVLDARTGQPVGIITEADIAHAVADGKDVNSTRIHALMTARPTVINTTTSVRDAARVMTSGHFRHLPVVGDEGLAGIVDITDVCRALLDPTFPGRPPAWPSRSSPRGTFTRPLCRPRPARRTRVIVAAHQSPVRPALRAVPATPLP